MKKLFGILLSALAAFFLFVGLKGLILDLPVNCRQIDETVWLESGQYDPENEGKPVTILFNPENLGNVTDPDLGIEIMRPAVRRFVDVFEFDDAQKMFKWKPVTAYADTELRYKAFAGTNQNAEVLSIDPAFNKMLPAGSDLGTSSMTPESLAKVEKEWTVYTDVDRTYLSNADAICFTDLENVEPRPNYMENVGAVRIRYTNSFDTSDPIAITGIQEGKNLVVWEDFKNSDVEDGMYGPITTKEEYKSTVIKTTLLGYLLNLLIIAILVYFALRCFGVIKVGIRARLNAIKKKNSK